MRVLLQVSDWSWRRLGRLIDLPVAVAFAAGAPALNFKRRQAIDFTDNGIAVVNAASFHRQSEPFDE
jgi:hypothetical protein